MTERRLRANGLSFRLVDEGDGPAVVLLHGFPDSADLWRFQIPALVGAGFRAVAPDLRGFGESDRPTETGAYVLPNLVADVTGIMDALGVDRAHVVGHDWGAILSWVFAATEPSRVDRLVVISVGHPSWLFRPSLGQIARSWYAGLFQLRGVAETALRARDWALFRALFGSKDVDRYVRDLSRPGALTAALGVYRANARSAVQLRRALAEPIRSPTMGVWAEKDFALTDWQMKRSERFVDASWRYERVNGGHWTPLHRPEELNRLLLEFFTAP